jgi:hypothetical protein
VRPRRPSYPPVSSRNKEEIIRAREEMTGEQPELWGTQRRDRLATLLQQIVEMVDRLQSGELTSGQEVQVPGLLLKAVHQMAEETGQLPPVPPSNCLTVRSPNRNS